MATNRLTPQQVVPGGLAAVYAVAGAGAGQLNVADTYYVNNDGKTVFHFKKSGAGACTVTVDTPYTVDGLAIAQRTINVPATTGDVFCGPFPREIYNQPGTHDLKFTLSEITGLTCAAVRV
jgi:hypothetical protein